MERAVSILGAIARVVRPAAGEYNLSAYDDITEAITQIVSRHPMTEEELRLTLERWNQGEVDEALERLAASGKVQVVERHGGRFWSAAGYRYPERCCSQGK
jgi:uncharacterized protein YcaQ